METRRCVYCRTLQRADQSVCRRCGRKFQLPPGRTGRSKRNVQSDAPSLPEASLHRAGHTFGLHPEDQPYQSSFLAVQRPPSDDTKQRRRMQVEPERITFPPTSETPALRKARHDAVEHIHARKQGKRRTRKLSRKQLWQDKLPGHKKIAMPSFHIRLPHMRLPSRTISFLLSLSCIFFLLAVSIIAFALLGKKATQADNVHLSMSPSVLRVHDTFTLTGRGFAPQVLISFQADGAHAFPGEDGKPLQVRTDRQGAFTLQGRIPDNWSVGSHVLQAEDSAQQVETSLQITILAPSIAPPALKLSQTSCNFPADAPGIVSTQDMILTNTGGGKLSWQASSDSPWLSVSPAQGTFSGQQSVLVTVNRGSLPARSYVGHLLFSQNGQILSQQMLTVSMAIKPAPAALAISTTSLTYTTSAALNPADQSITLHNTGGQSLNWTSTATTGNSASWLEVTPASGQLDPGASATVKIGVNALQLPTGAYQGTINFSGGATATVNVVLNVMPAGKLVVSPSELNFTTPSGKSPDEQRVILQNSGAGVLNWTVDTSTEDGSSWLEVIGQGGSLDPGSQTTLAVQIDSTALQPGSYQGTLTITSVNSTQTIAISLTVTGSVLSVQPTTINFTADQGTDPADQQITLKNTGNAPAQWQLSTDQSSLTVTPVTGTLQPGQQVVITVHASTASLTPDTYNATITCTDGAGTQGSQTVAVKIIIHAITPSTTPTAISTVQP